jgi:broad specificity phosphatase PhoE
MEITICRHGESDGNANKVCQGWTPGYLTKRGKTQAEGLGNALFPTATAISSAEYTEYDIIYCSDLTRVLETATIALGASKGRYSMSNVVISPLLREKNAGVLEGKPKTLALQMRGKSGDERGWKPKDGESWIDLQARIKDFTEGLLKSGFRRVLIFTSGGVIAEFFNAYVYKNARSYPNCAVNCSTYIFRYSPPIVTASENDPNCMMVDTDPNNSTSVSGGGGTGIATSSEATFEVVVENRRPIYAEAPVSRMSSTINSTRSAGIGTGTKSYAKSVSGGAYSKK